MSEINHTAEFSEEEVLEQAIRRLHAGESLESILAGSGPHGAWLAPLLATAAQVRGLAESVPVPPAQAGLTTFLAQAERMAPTAASSPVPAPRPWWQRLADSLRLPGVDFPRLAATALATMLLVVVLTVGSAFLLGSSTAAAQGVLPGQPLYPIKRLGEEMTLWLPQSSETRDARATEYEERRRNEVNLLLDHRLEAQVAFRGEVEALGNDQVVVDDIALQLTDRTQIEGPLAVGAKVALMARSLRDGALIAEKIVVEEPGPPTPTPSPTPLPTATATATPTQEPTSTPEPTATPTPTPDRSDSDSRVPPAPSPTQAPPPDEGENENSEGGNNDNENDDSDHSNDNDNSDDGNDSGNDNSGDGGENGADNNNDSSDNDNDDDRVDGDSDDGDNSNESSDQDSGDDHGKDDGSNGNDSSSSGSSDEEDSSQGGDDDNGNDNSN